MAAAATDPAAAVPPSEADERRRRLREKKRARPGDDDAAGAPPRGRAADAADAEADADGAADGAADRSDGDENDTARRRAAASASPLVLLEYVEVNVFAVAFVLSPPKTRPCL